MKTVSDKIDHQEGLICINSDFKYCPDVHINPHAGAATGTNSDENGAARFPFSATMGLREANYKAR